MIVGGGLRGVKELSYFGDWKVTFVFESITLDSAF